MSHSSKNITIKLIYEDSPYLTEINDLGDAHKSIFRFQPYAFYQGYAKKPGILVALEGQELAGYLIWSINTRQLQTKIWQLCVKPNYRGRKIAKLLNDHIVDFTKGQVRRIYLECLDDCELNEMWRKLGYVPISQKPAKMANDTLKIWTIEHIHPQYSSIFSIDHKFTDNNGSLCAVDAQTLCTLLKEGGYEDLMSYSCPSLGLCVTDEVFNEIDEVYNNDEKIKQQLRELINNYKFPKKGCDFTQFQQCKKQVSDYLIAKHLNLPETSIRYIARCSASDISYFITSYKEVLEIASELYINFGVRPISIEQSLNLREESLEYLKYQPARLEHSRLRKDELQFLDLQLVSQLVSQIYSQDVKKVLKQLRTFQNNLARFGGYVITYNETPRLCVMFDLSISNRLEIPFLKVLDDTKIVNTILNYVVNDMVKHAVELKRDFIVVAEPRLRESDQNILRDQYFVKSRLGFDWIKLSPRGVFTTDNAIKYLLQSQKEVEEYKSTSEILRSQLEFNDFSTYPLSVIDIERILWPLKIENSDICNFIIPIQPEAAKELFDENLVKESLFGVYKDSLFLSLESVYYKYNNPPKEMNQPPYRVLWYVSQSPDKGGYSGLSSIRACSQVDQVIIASPKDLNDQFQHLGFYTLSQIESCANRKNQVMAIKFSHTELFKHPVSLGKITEILSPPRNLSMLQQPIKNIVLQSPRKISSTEFIKLYRLGLNLE